jgi:hypothetical protein
MLLEKAWAKRLGSYANARKINIFLIKIVCGLKLFTFYHPFCVKNASLLRPSLKRCLERLLCFTKHAQYLRRLHICIHFYKMNSSIQYVVFCMTSIFLQTPQLRGLYHYSLASRWAVLPFQC